MATKPRRNLNLEARQPMQNACRHFLGLYLDDRPSCAKGRNVREWAKRCNGGSNFGIGLRLPCSARNDDSENTLFQCPELDRKSDDEIAKSRAALKEKMNAIMSALPRINELKQKMIEKKLHVAKANCPWCEAKDKLILHCAIEVNNHVHVKCQECGEGFIE